MMRVAPSITLVVLALASCSKATEVTVVVTSDVACGDLKGVSIAAATLADVDTRAPSTLTSRCTPIEGGSRIGSLVIVPKENVEADFAIRVVAGIEKNIDACNARDAFAGCIVARRILRFSPERELTVNVALRGACRDRACSATTTCVRAECRDARVDPGRCTSAAGCDEDGLGASDVDAGPIATPDGGDGSAMADGAPPCAPDEKACRGACVKKSDPAFGCSDFSCEACPGGGVAMLACLDGACAITECSLGHKLCGGNCVPADALHGCGQDSCTPCESTNGTATCGSNRACTIVCSPGTKFCDGKCVRINDPTYGCKATGCSASSCPDEPNGTLVCKGNACVAGSCGQGTKECSGKCVPTDANNGCETPGRCTPCAVGDVCTGSPASCACVPESLATTCATRACGTAVNNCGQPVTCPDTCTGGTICGGLGATPTTCGCKPDDAAACLGKACGPVTNNCGQTVTCPNTCTGYNTCGGGNAGPNGCGCTPIPLAEACVEGCGQMPNGCGGTYRCGSPGKICP